MTFSSSLRGLTCAVSAALPLMAGCASPVQTAGASGAANTGAYPNLNVPPPVASTQFTPYSLAQHNARLAAAKQSQDTASADAAVTLDQSAADADRLKQLGGTHGESTLNDIESASTATPASN